MSQSGDPKNPEIPAASGVAPVGPADDTHAVTQRIDPPPAPLATQPSSPAATVPMKPDARRPVGEKVREDAVAHSTDLREQAVAYARGVADKIRK